MAADKRTLPKGGEIRGEMRPGYDNILSPEALGFIAGLERKFGPERRPLLARRAELQQKLDAGWRPGFLPETRVVRETDWTGAPNPKDLLDPRVEITGPVDPKNVLNAIHSCANVYMAH